MRGGVSYMVKVVSKAVNGVWKFLGNRWGAIAITCLNMVCYGLLGVGFYMVYPPMGLIIPGALLWVELTMEARYARTTDRTTPPI